MPLPSLPPAFHLIGLDREVPAFDRAVRAAPRGADDGTVYWTERSDRLELAVVLEPEAPSAATLEAVYVLTVAAGEALAHALPPAVPIAYAWPGDILLDGARTGAVRAAVARVADPAVVPPWLVLGLRLDVASPAADPGRLPDRTSLADQGAGDATVTELVEGVTRQLLLWTSRWLEDGPAPVRAAWNRRCYRRGETGGLTLGEERIEGVIAGLDGGGALVVGGRRLGLEAALELLER
jgi:BirA family transcriptional regulator, biotin operon repressor / biotin---[acetyl-CoA-carboxylase] ligase